MTFTIPGDPEKSILQCAQCFRRCGGEITDRPIRVIVMAYYQPPVEKNRTCAAAIASGAVYRSNPGEMAELILFVLNGVAWTTSKNVQEITLNKSYGDPRLTITILDALTPYKEIKDG